MAHFAPGKFALARQVRMDYAVVKRPPFGILGCVRFVKGVLVREQHNLYPVATGRKRFHLEGSMFRIMSAQHMALPAFQ
jgi:hypothetical protein